MHASQVPKNRRLMQCMCAIVWCLLSGGPIFGFAALKPVLVRSHVYESMCDVSINASSSSYLEMFTLKPEYFVSPTTQLIGHVAVVQTDSDDSGVAHCTPQDLKLNMMFTVGAVLTNVSALAIGRVLDVYGPRVCGMIGAVFLYLACFIFIFNKSLVDSWLDPYLVGYACMALGGPFCFISSFQLSNSFPERSGTILALLTGAFDTSSAVFLIYRMAYDGTGGSFTLDRFFAVYLVVPIFISVAQILVMPAESYKTEGELCIDDDIVREPHHPHQQEPEETAITEDAPTETDALLDHHRPVRRDSIGDALKQPYASEGEASLVEHSGGIFGILHGYSAEFQLKTPWFYLLCLFATIQMLRLNYFVATINSQYTYLFHSVKQAGKLTRFFDVALPLGGVISVPFVGMLLDNFSTVIVLAVLLIISLAIGVLQLWGNFAAAIVTVLMFVAYRPFFYTAISDFCAKIFGFDTFGTVYGSIICISGIFNFGQSLLDKATHTKFGMNPTPINAILVITTAIIGSVTWVYVYQQAKAYNAKRHGSNTA